MSNWRTHIIGLVATVGLLITAQVGTCAQTGDDSKGGKSSLGGYAPCIVQPVFIKPNIAPSIITRDEIEKATIIKATPQRWQVEIADIEKPTFVEKVVLQAKFDGCAQFSTERKAAQKGSYYLPKSAAQTQSMGSGNVAARLLNRVDQCCGNAGGR